MKTKRQRRPNFPKFKIQEVTQKPIFEKKRFWGALRFIGHGLAQLKLNIDDKNFKKLLIMINKHPEIMFKLVPVPVHKVVLLRDKDLIEKGEG